MFCCLPFSLFIKFVVKVKCLNERWSTRIVNHKKKITNKTKQTDTDRGQQRTEQNRSEEEQPHCRHNTNHHQNDHVITGSCPNQVLVPVLTDKFRQVNKSQTDSHHQHHHHNKNKCTKRNYEDITDTCPHGLHCKHMIECQTGSIERLELGFYGKRRLEDWFDSTWLHSLLAHKLRNQIPNQSERV